MTKEDKFFKVYEDLINRGYDPDDAYNRKVVFTRANLDVHVFDADPGEDKVHIQIRTNYRSIVIDYEFPTSQDFSAYMDKVEKKYMAEVE